MVDEFSRAQRHRKEDIIQEETIGNSISSLHPDEEKCDYARANIPEIRVQTDFAFNGGVVLGLSVRGLSHKQCGSECQDFHIFRDLGDGWHLFVVSDGAGSAKYADWGSKYNCEIVTNYIQDLVSSCDWKQRELLPSELEWYVEIRSIFERTKLFFRNELTSFPDSVEKDFNATILVCIRTPKGILSAHIGDGRMGYRDGDGVWHRLMKPHKGDEANQTIFLQNSWTIPSVPAFRLNGTLVPEVVKVEDTVSSIVLLSDGCERSAWECVMWNESIQKYEDRNNPHPQFLDPLIDAVEETSSDEKLLCLKEILDCGTEACRKELDDKTILLGIY